MEFQDRNFFQQITLLWGRLNASEKLIVVASILILVVALIVWLSVTRQPANALLYGNLDIADAGRVTSQLESRNVSYSLTDGGRSILVPADKVNELRISLAADGFMPTTTNGYEILESSPLGLSDRSQRVRITQALEGELARTLMHLDEVTAARVHLTLPQPTPFIAEKENPAASVVLNIVPPGSTLSRENTGAVRTFVAGAIGANPDNVTIIDQNMNLLTGPTTESTGGLMPSQEEARRNYEIQRAADIRGILEPVYGRGNVAVSFSCEMDFDQVTTESIQYDPVQGTDHGILSHTERTEDSATGEGYSPPVGIPGTDSNIPSYVGATGAPYETESSTESKDYNISTTHENRVQQPGAIERCTVGVVIDSGEKSPTDIASSEIAEVQDLVMNAAGLDLSAGDAITVAFRQFDTSLQDELVATPVMTQDEMIRLGITIALFLLMIIFTVIILRNVLKPVKGGILAFAGGQTMDKTVEDVEVELPDIDPETLEKIRIREEIERLIKEDPVGASKVIKSWLKE